MKYRKKPVTIEAIQWNGNNYALIEKWSQGSVSLYDHSRRLLNSEFPILDIETLEGNMAAYINDWIIKGVKGEFYPCKPDIFEATYEKVEG